MRRKQFILVAMQAALLLGVVCTPGLAGEAGSPYLTHSAQDTGAGTVRLELVPAREADPAGSLRVRAVLEGPLKGEGATDIYAFNAILHLPEKLVSFVPGSVGRGDFLGRDERNWLVTAAVSPGEEGVLTVGGSRIGAVPGVAAPAGVWELFSLSLAVKGSGAAPIVWENASFIDSGIRPVAVARFVGATLHLGGGEDTSSSEDQQ